MSGFADCIDDLGKLHRQDRQLRLGSQEIEGRFGRMTIPLSPRPRERQSITGSQQAPAIIERKSGALFEFWTYFGRSVHNPKFRVRYGLAVIQPEHHP